MSPVTAENYRHEPIEAEVKREPIKNAHGQTTHYQFTVKADGYKTVTFKSFNKHDDGTVMMVMEPQRVEAVE